MKKQKKGFTLAELLIVVAIIAVLVAISIPIFSSQLKKARLAVDQANVRSAKAAAAADYMTNGETGDVSYIYDGSKAVKITENNVASIISSKGYGKSDGKDNRNNETKASGTPKNAYVEVTIDNSDTSSEKEQITARWVSSFQMKGNVSTSNLREQIEKQGYDPDDVIIFTADSNTKLNSNNLKQSNETLANMFKGFKNLKTIDLSNATLESGDINLFNDIPDSVTEIDLPICNGNYDITGKWYFSDGTYCYPNKTGTGVSNGTGTRITPANINNHGGRKIYRNPPAGTEAKTEATSY